MSDKKTKPVVKLVQPAAMPSEKVPAVKKAETTKKKAVATKKTATKKVAAKKPAVKKPTKKTKAVRNKPSVKQTARKKTMGVKQTKTTTNNVRMEKIMSQGKTQMDQMAKQATEMNREVYDAMMKSTNIFAKGCEEMMRVAMSFAQDTSQKQAKYMQEAMSSKTLNEFAEVQSKIAQASFDDFMSGATQISELGVKTLTEAVDPINTQMTKSMQKASTMMAA